jgi:PRC-barrel domain
MAGYGRRPISSWLLITFLVTCSSQIGSLHAQQQPTPSQPPEPQSSPPVPPPSPPVKQPEAAPKPAGEGIPALVVDGDQMMGVLGRQVRSSAGEDMGRIVDVIIDKSARVRAAVIDFGGFLGVGNRQIAVAWSAIRLPGQDKPGALVVDFTRDQLRVAPTYKAGEQVVLLGLPDAPAPTSSSGAAEKETPKEQPSK